MNCHPPCPHDKPAIGHCAFTACPNYRGNCPVHKRKDSTPAWLRERVNDPYGTGNRHEFWASMNFETIGPWRIFERDGMWWMYETRQKPGQLPSHPAISPSSALTVPPWTSGPDTSDGWLALSSRMTARGNTTETDGKQS